MRSERVHSHRGRRSREARKLRALTHALNAHPTVGLRQHREGSFHPNHDREHFPLDAHVPDGYAPPDPYFEAEPGAVYQEVCDHCYRHGYADDCPSCGGVQIIRRGYVSANGKIIYERLAS